MSVLLFAFAAFVFGVRADHYAYLVVAILSIAYGFSGIMMLAATLGRTENAVSGAAWGILLVFSMLGGGMIPLIAMPAWMQNLSDVSPVKWGIVALEGAIWRGYDAQEMALPCGVLIAVGTIALISGSSILNRVRA